MNEPSQTPRQFSWLSINGPNTSKRVDCRKAVSIVWDYCRRFDSTVVATNFFLGIHGFSNNSNKVSDLYFQDGMFIIPT